MVIYENTLTQNAVSIQSDEYGMTAYVNSTRSRAQLEAECTADIVQEVEAVWGTAPTVTDPAFPILTLEEAKQSKLSEISAACQTVIYGGVDATDTKGTEHFGLTIEDQTNLSALASAVAQGAAFVPYHADGQLCRTFTAAEFSAVYAAAKVFITKNVTLCNHLNVWIRRCTTTEEISAITYASTLPDDLLENYNAVLGITSTATA